MLKRKGYWKDMHENYFSSEIWMKESIIMLSAFGDVFLIFWMDQGENIFCTIDSLDARVASAQTSCLLRRFQHCLENIT